MKSAREIIQSLPSRFKKDKVSKDFEVIFHFEIKGDRGGDFTVKIENGACTVEDGLHGEPKCVVKTKDETYEKLEYGKTNPQTAFMFGKVKVSNINAMLKFVGNFKPIEE